MKIFSLFILSLLITSNSLSGADWNVYIAKYKQDKACAISYTFDDGLAEHYTLVAPQLEKEVSGEHSGSVVPKLIKIVKPLATLHE